MSDALAQHYPPQLVPAGYAEKAMASLMQLHSELMDEKERRVDLFRRLMEREQALAELKMYVKVLEDRVAATDRQAAPRQRPLPPSPVPSVSKGAEPSRPGEGPRGFPPAPQPVFDPLSARITSSAQVRPPLPPQVYGRRPDGWKVW